MAEVWELFQASAYLKKNRSAFFATRGVPPGCTASALTAMRPVLMGSVTKDCFVALMPTVAELAMRLGIWAGASPTMGKETASGGVLYTTPSVLLAFTTVPAAYVRPTTSIATRCPG